MPSQKWKEGEKINKETEKGVGKEGAGGGGGGEEKRWRQKILQRAITEIGKVQSEREKVNPKLKKQQPYTRFNVSSDFHAFSFEAVIKMSEQTFWLVLTLYSRLFLKGNCNSSTDLLAVKGLMRGQTLSHPSSCMLVNHGPSQQSCTEGYRPWKWGATARYYVSPKGGTILTPSWSVSWCWLGKALQTGKWWLDKALQTRGVLTG